MLLALGAAAGWLQPAVSFDWQPALALTEPWRAWTAAWVHWSPRHLGFNLAGCAVLAWFGLSARLPVRMTLAWLLAWPLTHFGLLAQPALAHYGGLSGVLHAGVAVAATWLLFAGRGRRRTVGAAVAAGVLLKVALERPWAGPLATVDGWDIALAPLAHASGVLAGALSAALLLAWPQGDGTRQREGAPR